MTQNMDYHLSGKRFRAGMRAEKLVKHAIKEELKELGIQNYTIERKKTRGCDLTLEIYQNDAMKIYLIEVKSCQSYIPYRYKLKDGNWKYSMRDGSFCIQASQVQNSKFYAFVIDCEIIWFVSGTILAKFFEKSDKEVYSLYISQLERELKPQVFFTFFFNHAYLKRLEAF